MKKAFTLRDRTTVGHSISNKAKLDAGKRKGALKRTRALLVKNLIARLKVEGKA